MLDGKSLFATINQAATLELRTYGMTVIFYYIKKDYAKAFDWFKKMANRGQSDGQYKIGEMYYEGLGTEKNLMQAAMWYMKAAESGYTKAQFHLAKMYFKGEGVIQDYVEAYKWANLAAAKGTSYYAALRDAIKKEMTPEQIAEGQKRARELYDKQQEGERKLWESIGVK